MNVVSAVGGGLSIEILMYEFIAPGSSMDEWPLNSGFTVRVYDEDDQTKAQAT